jgi:hypothetical protein
MSVGWPPRSEARDSAKPALAQGDLVAAGACAAGACAAGAERVPHAGTASRTVNTQPLSAILRNSTLL